MGLSPLVEIRPVGYGLCRPVPATPAMSRHARNMMAVAGGKLDLSVELAQLVVGLGPWPFLYQGLSWSYLQR